MRYIQIDLFRWPPCTWPFQEAIGAAVKSFMIEGRGFDSSKSACQQLKQRILETHLPSRLEALVVVDKQLTEAECRDICLSCRQGSLAAPAQTES